MYQFFSRPDRYIARCGDLRCTVVERRIPGAPAFLHGLRVLFVSDVHVRPRTTDDQIAEKVSKSRAAITNSMRLLKLDNRVQEMVIDEKISMGLARALLGVDDSEKQYEMAQDAFDRRMSVRDVEKLVKQLNAPKKAEKKKQDLTQYQLQFDEYAQKMADALGVKVAVTLKDKNTGRLEIDFYNTDDFERLYDRLK